MKKRLSHSDLRAFEECPQQYLFRVKRAKRGARRVEEAVGDITHAAAADNPEERAAIVAEQLEKLPPEKRKEVAKLVEELVTAAEEMGDEQDVSDLAKENQLRWLDPETGWELMAKPDEIGMVEDTREGGEMLQILDMKTAYRVRFKHKEQLYFFAMVARLARKYPGVIKLVVRLLRSREDVVFFSSPRKLAEDLAEVRKVIRAIERRLASGNFEARTGRHCEGCPYRERCLAYQALQQKADKQSRTPGILPVIPATA